MKYTTYLKKFCRKIYLKHENIKNKKRSYNTKTNWRRNVILIIADDGFETEIINLIKIIIKYVLYLVVVLVKRIWIEGRMRKYQYKPTYDEKKLLFNGSTNLSIIQCFYTRLEYCFSPQPYFYLNRFYSSLNPIFIRFQRPILFRKKKKKIPNV